MPDGTKGPDCSGNSTAFRAKLLEGVTYNNKVEKTDENRRANRLLQAEAYWKGISYLDEVGVDCETAIITTLSPAYWKEFGENWYTRIPINLLYNAGFMWVDAVNYMYYTPKTVPDKDWGFFTMYLFGDFAIRIFYHDATP